MKHSSNSDASSAIPAFLLFFLGFGLFMFTRRSELVPTIQVMIVLAPIFILRFSRTLPLWRAIVLTVVGFFLSMNIALWGLFEISGPFAGLAFNVIRSTMLALLYALPYLIDRVLYQRFGPSVLSVLAFPMVVTAMLFLSSLEGPFDGTAAKNVYAYGSLELKQLYALTGLWGFVFLWSLPAALINLAWARGFQTRVTILSVAALAFVGAGIYGYGAVRLASADTRETVKVAAVVLLPEDGNAVSMESFFSSKRVLPYGKTIDRIERLTDDAVARGANLVAFQEFALTVMESDIGKVRADYQRIARRNAVWLSITYS